MITVGLLHTSPAHVPTFDALLPGVRTRHVVDESLLSAEVRPERVAARLREAAAGAAAVLCTCSTIGAIAESLADSAGVPVVRADRPMAEAAARIGGVIGVVFAVPSTLGPTEALLREAAPDAAISMLPCPGAWSHFLAGDLESYVDMISAVLREHESMVDVFVLAQASMAPAAQRCAGLRVPVLSSPALAAAELLRRAGG